MCEEGRQLCAPSLLSYGEARRGSVSAAHFEVEAKEGHRHLYF